MLPRPTDVITLLAADGRTQIPFYPDDIKALATLLWGKGYTKMRIISSRCNVRHPAEDRNGRIIPIECFDTNPGTWHLSLINQIGVAKRGLALDAAYDYEVWTQPIYSYEYGYFNPQTKQIVDSLERAVIPIQQFTTDKFSAYRSPRAKYVAGIALEFVYVGENSPSHQAHDSPADDSRVKARYIYDVELDGNHNIVGGEWYQSAHPDFLFVPVKGSHALSYGDLVLQRSGIIQGWDTLTVVPESWRQAAWQGSSYGQPLAAIVERMIGRSQQARIALH